MKIRTISGATMQEAMAKVREELGPEAVILHVEDSKSRKGVLVRAAAESHDTVGLDVAHPRNALDVIENRLESELRARLRVFQPVRAGSERHDPQIEIVPALEFHRVPSGLAADLIRVAAEAAASSAEAALAVALERAFGCGPMPHCPARPIIAVGSPGHGKTTALARLAAQAASAGSAVTLATLDIGKAGAVAQIETYGSLLKARVEICENEEDLRAVLVRLPAGATFIDTAGINPWNAQDVAQTRRAIEASGAEPVWIASAECDPHELADQAELYRSLGVRRMIATKLDAARRLGGVAAAAAAGRLALAGTVSSPFLAEGVEPPNHLAFATRLLETYRAHSGAKTDFKEAKIA